MWSEEKIILLHHCTEHEDVCIETNKKAQVSLAQQYKN